MSAVTTGRSALYPFVDLKSALLPKDKIMYQRTIDLMDKSVFPPQSFYAQNKNPKAEITTDVRAENLENQEIINYVVNEMKDTLGNKNAAKSL